MSRLCFLFFGDLEIGICYRFPQSFSSVVDYLLLISVP